MKALITGASSGIGADMARVLSSRGYELILVARNEEALKILKKELPTKVKIIPLDISTTTNCADLYKKVEKEKIEIVINCAGFGMLGDFTETSLNQELNMIDLNVKALHTLTKLFLKDFKKKNHGYILNVGSTASFSPGPLMATYFATKAYVLRLSDAIAEELKREDSNVYIGTLCPGPVNTNFNQALGIASSKNALQSYDVAAYAIQKMFQGKRTIIPSFKERINCTFNKIIPIKWLLKANYRVQKGKITIK